MSILVWVIVAGFNRNIGTIVIDAKHGALRYVLGLPDHRVRICSRRSERQDCGRQCRKPIGGS